MGGSAVRLQATMQGPGLFLFAAQFSAPEDDEVSQPSTCELAAGDGASYELAPVAPPTSITWREQRSLPLVTHQYGGRGPYTAELRIDGAIVASVVVEPGSPQARYAPLQPDEDGPALFAIAPVDNEPSQRTLRLHARALRPGQRLRVDAGAGQVRELAGEGGQELVAEMMLSYAKPGDYLVSVELLDGEGFWLETLAQTPLQILAPETEPALESTLPGPEARAVETEPTLAVPWLPYRNFKARPEGAQTYSMPGGGAVRRKAGAGLWMTARSQASAGGATWFQTAAGDWIRSDAVVFFEPSDLRGIVLDAAAPSPPPPPPPVGNRKGVVTATTLNVRRLPGATGNNPPIDVLRAGSQVIIFEERTAGGDIWYRVGVDRWIIAKWVRLSEQRSASAEAQLAVTKLSFPFGWVVPKTLEVRAQPGVAASNPVTGQLQHYDVRPIVQTVAASGATWYQVGAQQWVEARQIGVARLRPRPSSIRKGALWVAVNLSQQTAVCYEGDKPVFAASHFERVRRNADGAGHLPHMAPAGDRQDVGTGLLHRRRDMDLLLLRWLCPAHCLLARLIRENAQPRMRQPEPARCVVDLPVERERGSEQPHGVRLLVVANETPGFRG